MTRFGRSSQTTWRLQLVALLALFLILLGFFVKSLYTGLSGYGGGGAAVSREIPFTDVNPYGANFFLTREVEDWKRDLTLQKAAEGGLGWVKQQFAWEEVEPVRKGEFIDPATGTNSWNKFDEIVSACERHGLQIVARLDRPPDWTRQDNTYKERPPDNFEDYGDYVYEFVKRYRGRVDYIQVWNEPNIFPEWGNQAVNPKEYVQLLRIAYRRAKEANPNVVVLSAPLAITLGQPHPEPGKWMAMSDLLFLEEMYQEGARDYFDIYSANAFGMDLPPDDPPDANTLNFQRVSLHREIMERHNDNDKPIWFNEFGWNASPDTFTPDRLVWRRVDEQQQAEWTVQAIEKARSEWPWAGVLMIWYFRQVGSISPDRADYYFRMVDVDFTPRPLYLAVQEAAQSSPAEGPGLYQETSPAVSRSDAWELVLDPGASGHAYIASDTMGDSLTFRFRGSGVDMLTRAGPDAGRVLVSLNGHPVSGLPTDASGASYVDLYSPRVELNVHVPLVRAAGSGEHTLTLTTAPATGGEAPEGQRVVLDAFVVMDNGAATFPVVPLVASGLGLVVSGVLLWRTWRRARWLVRSS